MNTVTAAPNEPMDILLHIALLASPLIAGWAFNYAAQHDPPPGSEARTVAGNIIATIIIFPLMVGSIGVITVYLCCRLVRLSLRKPVQQNDTPAA